MISVLPDVESIVVAYLKTQADVIALVNPNNIATELGPDAKFPFLAVTLTGGTVPAERHLSGATVQVDAWGGTRLEARTLAATAHAALIEMVGPVGALGVVTGVATLIGLRKLTDPVNNRPRYLFEVRIWASYP